MKIIAAVFTLLAAASLTTAISLQSTKLNDQVVVRAKSSQSLLHWCNRNKCDIWSHSPSFIDFATTHRSSREFLSRFPELEPQVVSPNVGKMVDQERSTIKQLAREYRALLESEDPSTADDAYFDSYHTYPEMTSWSTRLAKRYPQLVTIEPSIGKTIEDRSILLARVTGTGGDSATKKRVWVQGLLHAREWISGATVQYLMESFSKGYADKNERIVKMMDEIEFLFVPCANPDGYTNTWRDGQRLWRKNMRRAFENGTTLENGTVFGVDLNRNWPMAWGVGLSSTEPLDETYIGEKPLSEPEVVALHDRFLATPNKIGALDMHSFTQLLLRPFGYTQDAAPLYLELPMAKLSESMKQGILKVNGTTNYTTIRAVDLYQASGWDDWVNIMGAKPGEQRIYGMTVELAPGLGPVWEGGFILPPTRIRGVGEEMTEAVLRFAEFTLANPLPKKGGGRE